MNKGTDTDFACLDFQRQQRCGWPEVIYGEGKTAQQITEIFLRLMEAAKGGQGEQTAPIFATRCSAEKAELIQQRLPSLVYDETAGIIYTHQPETKRGLVAVFCAGTSDLPVAAEAALTAELMGCQVERVYDVGIAGIHRLLAKVDLLHIAKAIVAVAGMEGALPSVIGGLTAAPVIAVPTSVGYGASFNGLAALLAMLNSCAAGLSVVNIDNGFGAGYMAAVINNQSV
jgi:NCAIR mutase (PurE)-related protein